MFNINVLTLFPEVFPGTLNCSIIGKAKNNGIWSLKTTDIKKFSSVKGKLDDKPFGGGPGMVLKADVLDKAYQSALNSLKRKTKNFSKLILSPRGERINENLVDELSKFDGMLIVCGRYEGVDERFAEFNNLRKISIGDFVLCGGEVAALTILEAVIRKLPKVLGNPKSLKQFGKEKSSFDYPQFTKPRIWKKLKVPEILLSGNHEEINEWRINNSFKEKKKKNNR